jgi:hypothetical protein
VGLEPVRGINHYHRAELAVLAASTDKCLGDELLRQLFQPLDSVAHHVGLRLRILIDVQDRPSNKEGTAAGTVPPMFLHRLLILRFVVGTLDVKASWRAGTGNAGHISALPL